MSLVFDTQHFVMRLTQFLVAAVALFGSPVLSGEVQPVSNADAVNQQVTEKFAEFGKTQDPAFVHQALDAIEAAEANMPLDDPAARKLALARRLHFFAVLDRYLDPAWNEKNVPPQGVPPPTIEGGVYGSGQVDPATIPDPKVRAQYVQELEANKQEIHHYFAQMQLHRIDDRAMRFLQLLLSERYTNSDKDRQEFEGVLTASAVSEARKQRLRALMHEKP